MDFYKENKNVLAPDIAKEVLGKVKNLDIAGALLLDKYMRSDEEGLQMINSEEYRSILFVTIFFPFISNSTPVINFEELIAEQDKTREVPFDAAEVGAFLNSTSNDSDLYSLIMQEALNNVRVSH